METSTAAPATPPERERKTFYYLTEQPLEFKTKSDLEKYLTEKGGASEGQVIVKGHRVIATAKQVFKL